MMRWRLLAVLIAAGGAHLGWAQDAQSPIVRVEVNPPEVNVGQALRLRVTVLAPTWFTKPPVYPNFELANALTRLPADSSFPTSQRIGGDTWSGIVRDYEIYPQLAARYVMADQTVRVAYMNPEGFQPTTLEVHVPEIAFQASVPAGAESLEPFLGATQVTLEREIEGDLASLEAGDAIVMKVTATIEGMPAMFLPALISQTQQPGLALYPKEPAVEDGKVARRVEEVTVLFEGGGEFTLPALELGWWDTVAQQVEVAAVPEVAITVAGPAVPTDQSAQLDAGAWPPRNTVWRLLAVLVLLGLAALLPRSVRWLKTIWHRRRRAWLASERFAFRRLLGAVAACDAVATDHWLTVWLERLDPGVTSHSARDLIGTPDLWECVHNVSRGRYGKDPNAGVGKQAVADAFSTLGQELRRTRSGYRLQQHNMAGKRGLPPLNPTFAR